MQLIQAPLNNDINKIIEAVKTKRFDPKICHAHALENFNSKIMTEDYLKLYEKILKGESLNKTPPYAN